MEQKKESKTVGIIATVAAALICGCTALIACIFGVIGIFGAPFTSTVNGFSNDWYMPQGLAIGLLCLSVIFIIVPILVGVFTLRKKKAKAVVEVNPGEPLPPPA